MAKKKKQSFVEREQSRKGKGTISRLQLFSCYGASLLIVVLCLMEAWKPETQATGDPAMYYFLAALGVGFSIFITVRNNAAKKEPAAPGRRLK